MMTALLRDVWAYVGCIGLLVGLGLLRPLLKRARGEGSLDSVLSIAGEPEETPLDEPAEAEGSPVAIKDLPDEPVKVRERAKGVAPGGPYAPGTAGSGTAPAADDKTVKLSPEELKREREASLVEPAKARTAPAGSGTAPADGESGDFPFGKKTAAALAAAEATQPPAQQPTPQPAPQPAPRSAPPVTRPATQPVAAASPAPARMVNPNATMTGGLSPAIVYLQNLKVQIEHFEKEIHELRSQVVGFAQRHDKQFDDLLKRMGQLQTEIHEQAHAAPVQPMGTVQAGRPLPEGTAPAAEAPVEVPAPAPARRAVAERRRPVADTQPLEASPAPEPVPEPRAAVEKATAETQPAAAPAPAPARKPDPVMVPMPSKKTEPEPEPVEPVLNVEMPPVEPVVAPVPAPAPKVEASVAAEPPAKAPIPVSIERTVAIEPVAVEVTQPVAPAAAAPAAEAETPEDIADALRISLPGQSDPSSEGDDILKPKGKGPVWPV